MLLPLGILVCMTPPINARLHEIFGKTLVDAVALLADGEKIVEIRDLL